MTITSRVIDAALNQKGGMKEPAIKAGYLITGDQKDWTEKIDAKPDYCSGPEEGAIKSFKIKSSFTFRNQGLVWSGHLTSLGRFV